MLGVRDEQVAELERWLATLTSADLSVSAPVPAGPGSPSYAVRPREVDARVSSNWPKDLQLSPDGRVGGLGSRCRLFGGVGTPRREVERGLEPGEQDVEAAFELCGAVVVGEGRGEAAQ